MPLLCELGWHDAIPAARWNEGYYFTKCRRCRQDLVRTAYSGWHIPNGFRIVWQGRPPGDRPSARLVVDPDVSGQQSRSSPALDEDAVSPGRNPEAGPLPIQAVLDQLGPPVAEAGALPNAAEATPIVPQAERAPRRALEDSSVWDEIMGVPPGSRVSRPSSTGEQAAATSPAGEDLLRVSSARRRLIGALKRRGQGETAHESDNDVADEAPTPRFGRWAPALILLPVGLLALAAALLGEWTSRPAPPPVRSEAPRVVAPVQATPAFVSASLLNCRTSPTEDAATVRRLARGEPLSVLETTMGWASVSHKGRQCWAMARYIAVEQPL